MTHEHFTDVLCIHCWSWTEIKLWPAALLFIYFGQHFWWFFNLLQTWKTFCKIFKETQMCHNMIFFKDKQEWKWRYTVCVRSKLTSGMCSNSFICMWSVFYFAFLKLVLKSCHDLYFVLSLSFWNLCYVLMCVAGWGDRCAAVYQGKCSTYAFLVTFFLSL